MYISQNPLTETVFMQGNKAIDSYLVGESTKIFEKIEYLPIKRFDDN